MMESGRECGAPLHCSYPGATKRKRGFNLSTAVFRKGNTDMEYILNNFITFKPSTKNPVMSKSRILLFIFILAPIILISYWAHVNGSTLMLVGIAAWYLGGAFHFGEYGIIVALCGVLTILYFTFFGQPFGIRDPVFSIFMSMLLGYVNALVYESVKEMENRRKGEIEDGLL